MAVIGVFTGVAMEALPSPVAAPVTRSSTQRPQDQGASIRSTPVEKVAVRQDKALQDGTFLSDIVDRARNVALGNTTSLSFARDTADGQMYLYIKDRGTGEDLYRIPKRYLANMNPQLQQRHQVDVLI